MTTILKYALLKSSLLAMLIAAAPDGAPFCAADGNRSDRSLMASVKQKLRGDHRLADLDLEASVRRGEVTLKGNAPSYYEKYRAQQLCQRIDGVQRVRSQIKVRRTASTDAGIASLVKNRLNQNIFLRQKNLAVKVSNRDVTLSGQVDSWTQKHRAEMISRQVPSVRRIRNDLHVAPSPANRWASADEEAETNLLERLAEDDDLADLKVTVEVRSGVAILKGAVENEFQEERILHHARSVRDVWRIDSRLTIATSPDHV